MLNQIQVSIWASMREKWLRTGRGMRQGILWEDILVVRIWGCSSALPSRERFCRLFLGLRLSMSIRQLLIFLLALPGNSSKGAWNICSSLEPVGIYFHNCLVQRLLGKHKRVTLAYQHNQKKGPSVYLVAKATNSISSSYSQKARVELFISHSTSGHYTDVEVLWCCVWVLTHLLLYSFYEDYEENIWHCTQ